MTTDIPAFIRETHAACDFDRKHTKAALVARLQADQELSTAFVEFAVYGDGKYGYGFIDHILRQAERSHRGDLVREKLERQARKRGEA
jgi:hypothetical protein